MGSFSEEIYLDKDNQAWRACNIFKGIKGVDDFAYNFREIEGKIICEVTDMEGLKLKEG